MWLIQDSNWKGRVLWKLFGGLATILQNWISCNEQKMREAHITRRGTSFYLLIFIEKIINRKIEHSQNKTAAYYGGSFCKAWKQARIPAAESCGPGFCRTARKVGQMRRRTKRNIPSGEGKRPGNAPYGGFAAEHSVWGRKRRQPGFAGLPPKSINRRRWDGWSAPGKSRSSRPFQPRSRTGSGRCPCVRGCP